jgi:hypothetical protein
MAGITKKELSARRQRLRDELPNHGWDYVKAGVAAGYSPSYTRARLKKYVTKDSTFCQQVEAKRREIEAKTEDRREKRLRQLDDIIDNPNTTPSIKLKAIDLQGKMCGWHSETTVLETTSRQNELNEIERQEAQRLALLRFNALPQMDIKDDDSGISADNDTSNTATSETG